AAAAVAGERVCFELDHRPPLNLSEATRQRGSGRRYLGARCLQSGTVFPAARLDRNDRLARVLCLGIETQMDLYAGQIRPGPFTSRICHDRDVPRLLQMPQDFEGWGKDLRLFQPHRSREER